MTTTATRSPRTQSQPNRLPSPRERRPMMAGLAVLLILLGAVGAGYFALQNGAKDQFLVLTRDVDPYTRITSEMLGPAKLGGETGAFLSASQRDALLAGDYKASTRLFKGQVLMPAMLTLADRIPPKSAEVRLDLKGLPPGIKVGDAVQIIDNGGQGGGASVIVPAAQVTSVGKSDDQSPTSASSNTVTLVVLVATTKVQPLSVANFNNQLSVALLGPGTKTTPQLGGK